MENPAGNPVGTARGLPLKDSANTDLIHHDGKVLATWYLCGQPMALDPLSLETLGAETFLDTLRGDVMAHPKADERTGELMWFDYGAREPLLRYGVVGASGKVEHEVPIDLPGPRLPHDMAITEAVRQRGPLRAAGGQPRRRRRLPGQLRHRRARRAFGGRDPRRVRHRRGPGGAGAAAATGAAGFPRHLGAR
jgi:hypothetical protein